MNYQNEFSTCFLPVPNFPPQNQQTLSFLFNTNQSWERYSSNVSNITNDANSNCNLRAFRTEANDCDQDHQGS